MKSLLLRSVALALLSGTFGCSLDTEKCTDVNQDRVYQSLGASYDAETTETTASVQLRFGDLTGTTLEFDKTCAVTHDSYSLTKGALSGLIGTTYYGAKTELKTDHSFTFTDGNGKEFKNSGTISAIAMASPPSEISKAAGVTVSWTGGAIGEDESVYIYLQSTESSSSSGSTTSSTSFSTSTSTKGATSISVKAADIATLTTGAKKLYLRRNKLVNLTNATTVGGTFSTNYYTTQSAVTVKD